MSREVRVRFAPSPTGPLHIGGLRTALYNYLFARKNKGTFILRIEDTDQKRFVEGAETYINKALSWVGIEPDESPNLGGDFGPYTQSERKTLYQNHTQQLLDSGYAYYAFDTPEELEMAREKMKNEQGEVFQYNAKTREGMKNSLVLSSEQVQKLIEEGHPYVVRLKVTEGEVVVVPDLVRGEVMVNSEEIDDKILMKSGGLPTYHLANVVDDYHMKISHVIRGEEWLPSAPLHVLLYKYLGWENQMPVFAHLPLLLKPDGKGKLSKRDGLKHGFPVFPLAWTNPGSGENLIGFKESGYLPDAFTNFLVFLGWNPGTEQEIFSLGQLESEFSIERIGKSGARFDIEKAKWFNEQYLKEKPVKYLADQLAASLKSEGIESTPTKNEGVAGAMRERITFPNDIWEKGKFFFLAPVSYDEKMARKKWNSETSGILIQFADKLNGLESMTASVAKGTLTEIMELNNVGMGKLMPGLRLSLTGGAGGPDLMTIIEILGPQECSNRIKKAVEVLRDFE